MFVSRKEFKELQSQVKSLDKEVYRLRERTSTGILEDNGRVNSGLHIRADYLPLNTLVKLIISHLDLEYKQSAIKGHLVKTKKKKTGA
tara:strand:+ start:138 stop:401 length:264 start_codon:yes stop_codon:yes gene_type:complete